MLALGDESTDGRFHFGRRDATQLLSEQQFRECGSTGDARRASTGLVRGARDPALGIPFRRDAQDVAADRIADLDGYGRRGQFAHVARILEMVEELGRARHEWILFQGTLESLTLENFKWI
jgi:hypothetical protein